MNMRFNLHVKGTEVNEGTAVTTVTKAIYLRHVGPDRIRCIAESAA